MEFLPLLLLLILVIAMGIAFLRSKRRFEAEERKLRANIKVGSEVMTTSGLYGTVVEVGNDDTVKLSIAPGVEVKWALLALRETVDLDKIVEQVAEQITSDSEPGDGDSGGGTDGKPRR